jgi:branched-chain amino acid transport system substrate-binding protein
MRDKSFRTKRFLKIIIAVVIITTISGGLNLSSCDTKERIIRIGNQSVLSGEYSIFGEDQLVSLELAISDISPVRIGGFDYDIELITRDDEGNPEKAFLVAQEIVEQGAVTVIGSTFDGTTSVSIPVYEEYNIPIISPFAQKTDTAEAGDNFFRVIINNSQKIENTADFIIEKAKPARLILIDNRSEYSNNTVDYLQEILLGAGQDILHRYSLDFDGDDLTVFSENLLIDEPDYIFCIADYNELAFLMKKSGEAGVSSRFITDETAMDENIFSAADSSYLEGLIAIVHEPPSIAMYSSDQKAVDFWHSYNDMLEEKRKDMNLSVNGPGKYSPYVFDALLVAVESMKRSNSTIPKDFMGELRSTSFDGITGHIEFDARGNRVEPESTVFMIKDGAWVRYN